YDFFDSILPVHKEKSHYYFTDRAVSGLGMTLTWSCVLFETLLKSTNIYDNINYRLNSGTLMYLLGNDALGRISSAKRFFIVQSRMKIMG
ncbi:MAG: hypothetical protein RO469_08055, partial [Thermincola sp.]|nr:hypothetical protein [Thermincola sp.]MDT3702213.1 hypothetical protein [Thermincola sp.]